MASYIDKWMRSPLSKESYSDLRAIHSLLNKYQKHDKALQQATKYEDFNELTKDPRTNSSNFTRVDSFQDKQGRNIVSILDQPRSASMRGKLGVTTGQQLLNNHTFKNVKPYNIYDDASTINAGVPVHLNHTELQHKVNHRLKYEESFTHQPVKDIKAAHIQRRQKIHHKQKQRVKVTRSENRKIFAKANQLQIYLKHSPHFNSCQYLDQHPKLSSKLNVLPGMWLNRSLHILTGADPKANNSQLYDIDHQHHSFHIISNKDLFSKTNSLIKNYSLGEFSKKSIQTKAQEQAYNNIHKYDIQINEPMDHKDLHTAKLIYDSLSKTTTMNDRYSHDFSSSKVGSSNVANILDKMPPMFQHKLGIKSGSQWHKRIVDVDKMIGKDPKSDSEARFIKPSYIFSDHSLTHTKALTKSDVLHNVRNRLQQEQQRHRSVHIVHSTDQIKHNLQDAVMLKMGIKNHDHFYCSDFLDQHPKFARDANMIGDRTYYHGGINLANVHKVYDTKSKGLGYNTMNRSDVFQRTTRYIKDHVSVLSESMFNDKMSMRHQSINDNINHKLRSFKPEHIKRSTKSRFSITNRMNQYLKQNRGISR